MNLKRKHKPGHVILSKAILSLLLIQIGQFFVYGEKMGTEYWFDVQEAFFKVIDRTQIDQNQFKEYKTLPHLFPDAGLRVSDSQNAVWDSQTKTWGVP